MSSVSGLFGQPWSTLVDQRRYFGHYWSVCGMSHGVTLLRVRRVPHDTPARTGGLHFTAGPASATADLWPRSAGHVTSGRHQTPRDRHRLRVQAGIGTACTRATAKSVASDNLQRSREYQSSDVSNWESRAPPGSPNALFGAPRVLGFLTLAPLCQTSQTSLWLPPIPHFLSLAPALKFLRRPPCLS